MGTQFGVGIVGTGLAFQAIHARVLQGLAADFAIRAVWDPDPNRATGAAQWLGVRAAADCDELLADPEVDVVVIASPARFHAAQALAAMRAGKRAVLVEKPLCATPEEAEAIATEAQARGVVLLVGAMHVHDPAWLAAQDVLFETGLKPALVRSSIVLPPNARFEDWATEPLLPVTVSPGAPAPAAMSPADLMRLCVLELAIHDLPLVRRLVPAGEEPQVVAARLRHPFGYAVTVRVGDTLIDLTGMLHGHWQTDWTLSASGAQGALRLDFTPSFVSAGSGAMVWQDSTGVGTGTRVYSPSASNGYAGQWQALAAVLRGERAMPDPRAVADDFRFAHAIARQAAALVEKELAA